jgi:M6 family metalloprotease-like protein
VQHAAQSLPLRLAVLGLATGLFLTLAASLPARASAAESTVCGAQKQAARAIALRVFELQMMPARKAFFRRHKHPRDRRAFVAGQKRRLASLRSALRRCRLGTGTSAVAEGTGDPQPPPCSPSLFSAPYTEMNEGTTNSALPLRPDGQIRAVMLFVDFSDLHATESMSAIYDRLVPHSREWLTEVSYDRVRLDVAPLERWVRMPRPLSSYGLRDGINWPEHQDYIRDAVRAADGLVDFSPYQVVYVVAAKGSDVDRSPAFQAYAGHGAMADGKELRYGATFFEDTKYSARYAANVLIHETGHILGLPDLYGTANANDSNYWNAFRWAGSWDTMSWNDPGAHFLAWHKWKLGWLDSSQLTCLEGPGELTTTLAPLARSGGLKAVVLPVGLSSAYVIEARKRIGEDAGLCEDGVLVYSVDATTRSGNGPVRVRAAQGDTKRDLLTQCGPLYNAPFDKAAGEVARFEDAAAGFSVEVLSSGTNGYRVRVTRTSLSTRGVPLAPFSASAPSGVVSEGTLAPPLPGPAPFPFGIGWDLEGSEHEH